MNNKDEWDIDFSELEKIKNEKSDKSKQTAPGFNMDLAIPNEKRKEFVFDSFFDDFISKELSFFSTNISIEEAKIIQSDIESHIDNEQEVIVFSEEDINSEITSFADMIINSSKQKPKVFKKQIIKYEEEEDLDNLINDFNSTIDTPQVVTRKTVVNKSEPIIRESLKELNDLIINFKDSISSSEQRKVFKKKIIEQVKKQEIDIDPKLLELTLDNLSKEKTIIWVKHAEIRFNERVDEYSGITKEEINEFVKSKFNLNNLNENQEYEFLLRTKSVLTYKVVSWWKGNNILIKTIYRVDSNSKQEYQDSKNRFKK